jgi:prepilin-type N-terminal cleavage/methylation domain-containing protein
MAIAGINQRRARTARGFSLVETLIAMAIMLAAVALAAQMLALVRRANDSAESGSIASILARQKLEQLRTLVWAFDVNRNPLTDASSDVTVVPENPSGGVGLTPSPPDSLRRSTTGYYEFLDAAGQSLGAGPTPPPRTAYIRRWSIEPAPDDPDNAIVVQVRVDAWHAGQAASYADSRRLPDEARIVTARARKAP